MDERSFYRRVGELVQARRRALRQTQAELAANAGTRRTTVANIESGRQRVPLHVLYALAHALGTDIGHLVPQVSETFQSDLVTFEADGRAMTAPRRAADFVKRMRDEGEDVGPG